MEINEIKDVAKFLFESKIKAHIDTQDKDYFNGSIEELHDTFLILDDRYWGMTPIAFSDIKHIEKFRDKKEEDTSTK